MSVYEFGPFQLDSQRLLLSEGGTPIALGPKVVETLLALLEHPGDLLTKRELLDRIWPEGYVDEANLAQNVYVLRKVLRAHWDSEAIETIPRRGYRFTARVTRVDALAAAQPKVIRTRSFPAWLAGVAAIVAIALLGTTAQALFAMRRPSSPALSPDGARLYQMGHYYWNLRTRDGIAKSMEYFRRVIVTDPRDARGYAALASADAIMGDYRYGPLPPRVYFTRARAYARKALAVDPRCGQAYAVLGLIATEPDAGKPNVSLALHDFQRAIALDPNSGPAHEWYGTTLLARGRITQAYHELHQAAELDPLSVATTAWLGNAAYLEGRYNDAIAYARETIDLSPRRGDVYETLGLAYEARGDVAKAVTAFHHLAAICARCRPEAAALLAAAYAREKRMTQARQELQFAQARAREVAPEDLAVALASLGQRTVALSWLRRTHGGFVRAEIANDPRFALLRNG